MHQGTIPSAPRVNSSGILIKMASHINKFTCADVLLVPAHPEIGVRIIDPEGEKSFLSGGFRYFSAS